MVSLCSSLQRWRSLRCNTVVLDYGSYDSACGRNRATVQICFHLPDTLAALVQHQSMRLYRSKDEVMLLKHPCCLKIRLQIYYSSPLIFTIRFMPSVSHPLGGRSLAFLPFPMAFYCWVHIIPRWLITISLHNRTLSLAPPIHSIDLTFGGDFGSK